MRIQPRRQILDIWRSVIKSSYRDGTWVWGGREESNSLSDTEQLICLLYPATEVPALALESSDMMAEDAAQALELLGEPRTIPYRLVEIIEDYVERHTVDDEPGFGGGGYLSTGDDDKTPTTEQLAMGLVDAYSLSLTLCLAALGFLSVYKPQVVRRPALVTRIELLQRALSRRLTAAQIGLLRSFVVNTVGVDTEGDRKVRTAMLEMVNQGDDPDEVVVSRLRERLQRVRTLLLDDVRLGVSTDRTLEEETRLFEIGWGWGIVRNATDVVLDLDRCAFDRQPAIGAEVGVAVPRPYLYSTVLALDGINDLRSPRTRELNLLDEEQRRLAEALQIRWDLTQRYWSGIARFGKTWPLEDIPWRTSDGEESDYFSLLVSAVLVQDLEARQATDEDLNRAVAVFESLAQRGRITRRVTKDDRAVDMHVPGVRMTLVGSDEIGPLLYWHARDFAPLLLKRCLQAAALSANRAARDRLMRLAEMTMDHLDKRRIHDGDAPGLWDDPNEMLFPDGGLPAEKLPSWAMTERMVEALIAGSRTFQQEPLRSSGMRARAEEALHEAEHLLNRLLVDSDSDDTSARSAELIVIERRLSRAREVITEQPGTANALALAALLSLDEINVAQGDASRRT
ncbi:SCO2524 family protein [Umezawaea sp. Da 62-37]|uniref:SCO2524 family protein n=1 Tax=Umezawaea sp. Da 62-37 TaxID=3075927 RepID=UPI0028F7322E|nr:SCO2524 family protein [Umezawaea sp. Da 62-37]WNV88371.1 SCO2524 family protein [Umezawaea sp. Da 62-37]